MESCNDSNDRSCARSRVIHPWTGLGTTLKCSARLPSQFNLCIRFSVAKSLTSIHKSCVWLELLLLAYTHRHAILYILIEIKRCHYRHNCTFHRPDVTEEAHTVFETQTLKQLDAWDARDMALCWASSLFIRTF